MKEYKVKEVINRLQDEAGYATGGYVDGLVFSGLDVHEMLNEIEEAIIEDIHSTEKLQELRVEELKDFNSKILQAELENQKLQKEIDSAKKYIEESYKADKEDNKLLDLIIEAVAKLKSDNETAKKNIEHAIRTIKHDGHLGTVQTDWILSNLEKVLEVIGGDDDE